MDIWAVGFSGGCHPEGCGTLRAFFDIGHPDHVTTSGGVTLHHEAFQSAIRLGYATRLDPPIFVESMEGSIMYFATEHAKALDRIPVHKVSWTRYPTFSAAFVTEDQQREIRHRYVETMVEQARDAWCSGDNTLAAIRSRQGLDVALKVSTSTWSPVFYGILLAEAYEDDDRHNATRYEINNRLSPERRRLALRECTAALVESLECQEIPHAPERNV